MKQFKKIFAEVVSRVLDPVWEIPVAILVAIAFAVKEGLRWRFLGVLLFIDAIVPMIFFLTMLYHKQLSNWDMDKRSQRLPIYLFTLVCHLGGLWLAHELGRVELVRVLSVFYSVAIIFFLVTMKWKMSLHAGVNAGLITTINIFYGWHLWWLYGALCLVMWARVYQKHHTWAQVVAGAGVGIGVILVGFWTVGI